MQSLSLEVSRVWLKLVKRKQGCKGRVTLEKNDRMARYGSWRCAALQELDGVSKLLSGGRASCA